MTTAIINGRLLLPEEEIHGRTLLFGRTVLAVTEAPPPEGAEIINARGAYVAPGLVDVHIHGYRGDDVSDGDAEGIRRIARRLPENGVTCFLPTTMTLPRSQLETVLSQIRLLMVESREDAFGGAEIAGCHAEGPFLSPAKKGAQAESALQAPDAAQILPYADVIRILTFAPELPGAETMIRTLKEKTNIRLSVGHTDATFDRVMRALSLGADRFTHLFNAMTPLHHRAPGAVGAALSSDAWTELIADTFHVDPELFPLLYRIKGERLVLISDAVRACGLPDGDYTLGGQAFTLRGIECRMADGTIAGSVLKLNEAVRNLRDHGQMPMHTAVRCASLNPAASAGLADRKGSLLPGKDADVLLMDEKCRVQKVWIRGRTWHTAD